MALKTKSQIAVAGLELQALAGSLVVPSYIAAPGTEVQNRAMMIDESKDLHARMGVERVIIQMICKSNTEFGPNGECVQIPNNEPHQRSRFVGRGWYNIADTNGPRPYASVADDFVEFIFYGTGFNLLTLIHATSDDYRATIDGGAEGANFNPTNNGALAGGFRSINVIVPLASGLTLGYHKVKVRFVSGSSMNIYGYEILNEQSTVKVSSGTILVDGGKNVLSAVSSSAHNSGFESGTLGSRGGRVAVVLKSDGQIAKLVTPANASAAFMGAADHSNEDVARVFNFREFGGYGDFATMKPVNGDAAYALEDGSTSLIGDEVRAGTFFTEGEGVIPGNTNATLEFVFTGTGLDVIQGSHFDGGTDPVTLSIDGGASIGVLPSAGALGLANSRRLTKIVSGLPYGTHTFRYTRTASALGAESINAFVVYQPKLPTLPAGSILIEDYNILGNFVANATAGASTISQGVLRKDNGQGFIYKGTWAAAADTKPRIGVIPDFNSATVGDYAEYTFFGTGFDLRYRGDANRSADVLVTLNGTALTAANFPSAVFSTYGAGSAYNSGTGSLDQATTTTEEGSGFIASNLPLAKYTVRFTNNAADFMLIAALDVITPIHSHRCNAKFFMNGALNVGNCAMANNLQFLLGRSIKKRAVAQSLGADPTNTASGVVPDMNLPFYMDRDGFVNIQMQFDAHSVAGNGVASGLQVDGEQRGPYMVSGGATTEQNSTSVAKVFLSKGWHHIQGVYTPNSGGTIVMDSDRHTLTVEESD